jgi:flagellar basal-body rod protein FlgB
MCIYQSQGDTAMQVTTGLSEALSRYLDLSADQMKVTASNMANIDTPGYKTQGFDFEQEFSSAVHATAANSGPQIAEVDGLVARPDGNTVSLDRESLQLAKSQLQFRTGVELLKHEFSRVMSAIHAESK